MTLYILPFKNCHRIS